MHQNMILSKLHQTNPRGGNGPLCPTLQAHLLGMGMKSEYLNCPNIGISKSRFESKSYPNLPNHPDLWICFLCDLKLFLMNVSLNYFILLLCKFNNKYNLCLFFINHCTSHWISKIVWIIRIIWSFKIQICPPLPKTRRNIGQLWKNN